MVTHASRHVASAGNRAAAAHLNVAMTSFATALIVLLGSGSATAAPRKYVGLTSNCQNAVSMSGNEGAMTLAACEARCDAHAPSCEAVDYGTTACYLKSACGGTAGSCNGPSCAYRAVGAPAPPPPPPEGPPGEVTVAAGAITSQLSNTILGCHSDEGFMHQPQFFLSQMVYGEGFESTNGMKSGWRPYPRFAYYDIRSRSATLYDGKRPFHRSAGSGAGELQEYETMAEEMIKGFLPESAFAKYLAPATSRPASRPSSTERR